MPRCRWAAASSGQCVSRTSSVRSASLTGLGWVLALNQKAHSHTLVPGARAMGILTFVRARLVLQANLKSCIDTAGESPTW